MTNMKAVKSFIKSHNINPNTISLYVTDDCEFSTCDILHVACQVAQCTALTYTGELVEFKASDELIGGALGKVAGAF